MRPLNEVAAVMDLVPALADYAEALTVLNVKCAIPMLGNPWGFRRFWLASHCAYKNGLHDVTYFVIEKESGVAFGWGATKAEALGLAREFIRRAAGQLDWFVTLILDERSRRQAERESLALQAAQQKKASDGEKLISKRRLKVFAKSNGHCHYCECGLELAGEWHIEHMVPLSRGGPDTMNNLVAACAPCNYSKKTKTADEFIAHRAGVSA